MLLCFDFGLLPISFLFQRSSLLSKYISLSVCFVFHATVSLLSFDFVERAFHSVRNFHILCLWPSSGVMFNAERMQCFSLKNEQELLNLFKHREIWSGCGRAHRVQSKEIEPNQTDETQNERMSKTITMAYVVFVLVRHRVVRKFA